MAVILEDIWQLILCMILVNLVVVLRLAMFSGFKKTTLIYSLFVVNVVLILAYIFYKTGLVISKDTIVILVIILAIISFVFFYMLENRKK